MRAPGFLSRWSIVARLTVLSILLLAVLITISAFLASRLSENTRALNESGRFIGAVTTAYAATKTFGDLKYWLTDLAVSLLMRSEQQAYAARERGIPVRPVFAAAGLEMEKRDDD